MTDETTVQKRHKQWRHWSEAPLRLWAWPHFSPQEVACRHCGMLAIDTEAMDALERLRALEGNNPIRILSGYRCTIHNEKVGGAPASYHLKGSAFDLPLDKGQLSLAKRTHLAGLAGFRGVGLYTHQGFIHLDVGPIRHWQ